MGAVCKMELNPPDISGYRRSTPWRRYSPFECEASSGRHAPVSGKLRKTYPGVFSDEELAKRVERAVFKAFELLPDDDNDDDEVVPRLNVVAR
jgi:hypothetical protein